VVGLYGKSPRKFFEKDLVSSWATDNPTNYCAGPNDPQRTHCVLVISGGGGFGAFGAGILNGWSELGKRPNFKIVTGISTGALIAPFAFLGPAYDQKLKEAFTTIKGTSDILMIRGMLRVLFNESLGDPEPFSKLIARYVDADLLAAVAREHKRGKRLYVGTTNMDAQNFVAWNMGAIASRATPKALKLFRSVLIASASVPAIFPPVMIQVETPSGVFDEMHVDGGVETQFFYPGDIVSLASILTSLNSSRSTKGVTPGNFRLFIIRNARFSPEPKQVERNLGKISGRAVASMIQAMGQSDLYRLFAAAKARNADFNYIEIPADFTWRSDDEFDQKEMNRLFEIGRSIASTTGFWKKVPSGLFTKNIERLN
jgi:hypothetical protein